jgi:general stress protein CsbA
MEYNHTGTKSINVAASIKCGYWNTARIFWIDLILCFFYPENCVCLVWLIQKGNPNMSIYVIGIFLYKSKLLNNVLSELYRYFIDKVLQHRIWLTFWLLSRKEYNHTGTKSINVAASIKCGYWNTARIFWIDLILCFFYPENWLKFKFYS